MNESNPQQTSTNGVQAPPSPNAGGAAPVDPQSHIDPLTGLYRMSITAGVGSQDYVAINVTAIISVILGIASVLVIISSVFMIAPLVGLILGIVALRQIKSSNGTQTGVGLAVIGIVLSLGFASIVGANDLLSYLRTRADSAAIADLCQRFGNDCRDRNFDDAYTLFTPHFQSRMPLPHFIEGLRRTESQPVGPIIAASWNGRADFTINPDTGKIDAVAMIKLQYKNIPPGNEDREPIEMRKTDDGWKFENMLSLFPAASFSDYVPPAQGRQ